MTLQSLLVHKCKVQRNEIDLSSGSAEMTWRTVHPNTSLFLDLMFLRQGRDPVWTPEAGRAATRVGVAFFKHNAPIQNGDRIVMTKGPAKGSIFTLEMAIDEAWTPSRLSHLEVYVNGLPESLSYPYNERRD